MNLLLATFPRITGYSLSFSNFLQFSLSHHCNHKNLSTCYSSIKLTTFYRPSLRYPNKSTRSNITKRLRQKRYHPATPYQGVPVRLHTGHSSFLMKLKMLHAYFPGIGFYESKPSQGILDNFLLSSSLLTCLGTGHQVSLLFDNRNSMLLHWSWASVTSKLNVSHNNFSHLNITELLRNSSG